MTQTGTQHDAAQPDSLQLSAEQVAHYRREGYLVIPEVLGAGHVEACKTALSDLMQERVPRTSTNLYYEAGQQIDGLSAAERELRVRRIDSFCDDHPVLAAAAHSRRLHGALDQLFGIGRTLFQEMALVKPPGIGAAKPWHQDASYFMVRDPAHVIGTWIALDAATLDNGCMQFIPRSQLEGAAPHEQESLASCFIPPAQRSRQRIVAVPMQAGDMVVFHGLIQHFTDDNRSATRRRALQFHYCQLGAAWGTMEDHARLYGAEDGSYCGCITPQYGEAAMRILRGDAQKEVVPVDWP